MVSDGDYHSYVHKISHVAAYITDSANVESMFIRTMSRHPSELVRQPYLQYIRLQATAAETPPLPELLSLAEQLLSALSNSLLDDEAATTHQASKASTESDEVLSMLSKLVQPDRLAELTAALSKSNPRSHSKSSSKQGELLLNVIAGLRHFTSKLPLIQMKFVLGLILISGNPWIGLGARNALSGRRVLIAIVAMSPPNPRLGDPLRSLPSTPRRLLSTL